MPKIVDIQSNFNAGIFSPKMQGRVDYPRYLAALKDALNVIPQVQGGMKRRPGTRHIYTIDDALTYGARLIDFVQSIGNAYMLVLTDAKMRIFKNDALVATLTTPFTGALGIDQVRYTHAADTMIFTHPNVPVQRLVRVSDSVWRLSALPFIVPPLYESGLSPATSVTLSGTTGTITVTAAASVFLAGDVGRQFQAGAGIGTITAQGGTTLTVTVTNAFDTTSYASGAWRLADSPVSNVTPSGVDVGQTITLTASINTWRTGDVTKYVNINGGVVLITVYTSATVVSGVVQSALESTNGAYGGGWRLMTSAFTAGTGYPAACTLVEGRLVLAGTVTQPNTMWFSEVNNIRNFALGTDASSPMEWPVTSDTQDSIRHLVPSRALLVFTYASEFAVFGSDDGPLTPTTTTIRQQSSYGCALAAPETVGLSAIYAQRSGKKLRAADYDGQRGGYVSPDIGEIAEHLVSQGVVEIRYQSDPVPILWVLVANGLLSCTFSPEQSVFSWSRHIFGATNQTDPAAMTIGSIGVLPDADGDVLYLLQRNGSKVWLAKMDEELNHDAGILQSVATPTTPITPITSMPWLEGRNVAVTIDDDYFGNSTTVGAGGSVAFPAGVTGGFDRNIGLQFDSFAELLPREYQLDATIQGKQVGLSEVMLRVLETRAIRFNDEMVINRKADGSPVFNEPMPVQTGDFKVTKLGVDRNGPRAIISQGTPSPWHVLAVIRTISVNS